MFLFQDLPSPFGPLRLIGLPDGTLTALQFLEDAPAEPPQPPELKPGSFPEAENQLQAYFAKKRTSFDLPLAPQGTPFQQAVWTQLCSIPYGTCLSYGELAAQIGNPGGSRAVGLANNRNPIPIIIPCHRVIGSKGQLVGFGGGLDRKYQLLCHEGYYLV